MNPSAGHQLRVLRQASRATTREDSLARNWDTELEAVLPGLGEVNSNGRRTRAIALIAELIEALTLDESRVSTANDEGTFESGEVIVNPRMREVTRNGTRVPLSPREYDLLLALTAGNSAPVSREVLAKAVWQGKLSPESRTIDQHIGQLRKKLESRPAHPTHIITVPKYGYRLIGAWLPGK
jgi:DNA-binding response OmpR family regulator